MSEQSWLKEFYPVPADEVPENKAIKHSLVKWYGLRKENLKKHGLIKPPIDVDGMSCALCESYYDCYGCPLFEFNGTSCKYSDGVFGEYHTKGNPEPMIAALEVIEFVERTCK